MKLQHAIAGLLTLLLASCTFSGATRQNDAGKTDTAWRITWFQNQARLQETVGNPQPLMPPIADLPADWNKTVEPPERLTEAEWEMFKDAHKMATTEAARQSDNWGVGVSATALNSSVTTGTVAGWITAIYGIDALRAIEIANIGADHMKAKAAEETARQLSKDATEQTIKTFVP